jgi:hypothetical protein
VCGALLRTRTPAAAPARDGLSDEAVEAQLKAFDLDSVRRRDAQGADSAWAPSALLAARVR